MKSCEQAIRSLTESAERIKADRTIPENLKKAFLAVNQTLTTEARKYEESLEILRGSKRRSEDLLQKLNTGEITKKRYQEYLIEIGRAKRQKEETEAFAGVLGNVLEKSRRKKSSGIKKEFKKRGLPDRQRSAGSPEPRGSFKSPRVTYLLSQKGGPGQGLPGGFRLS
jgi:hypothetical protein